MLDKNQPQPLEKKETGQLSDRSSTPLRGTKRDQGHLPTGRLADRP